MVDTLTLTARGAQLVLFAPRPVAGGIETHALLSSAVTARPRIFRDDQRKKYRVPAVPFEGFRLVHVVLPEVGSE